MDDELEDGGGFDADDWSRLTPFVGVVATLDDVQARRAVFALGETDDPRPIARDLPQPVIVCNLDGRILIYSHDTMGLGHLRRCRTIAHSLVEKFKQVSVLILSGSPIIGSSPLTSRRLNQTITTTASQPFSTQSSVSDRSRL